MNETNMFTLIYFFYGLAFFCMGLAVLIEGDRSSDERLRLSLRPLVIFGFLHGIHEWMDMFGNVGMPADTPFVQALWYAFKLGILSFSFLSLAGFGFSLLSPDLKMRRLSFLAPLMMAGIWAIGMWVLNDQYEVYSQACQIPCVWTRYSLGIPSAMAASIGLIVQQRAFRRSGMVEFGRDSLVAAIAFAWYGIVGQLFVPISRLPPSTFLNQELFYEWFGFPVQILRAVLAVFIAIFVIRFMRAFDTEIQKQIEDLQALQLEEARRREVLRGGLIKRIVAAQEAERQRIARELHDGTGQALTALGLGLRGVSRTIKTDQKKASNNLRQLEILVSNSLNELQRIIANLRPSHLDDLGLAAAIRWFISDAQNHTNLVMTFHQEGEERPVSGEVKIAIYRVVQEAVTNAIKYSHGNSIRITLSFLDRALNVTIEDDGVGMNIQDLRSRREQSWGLMGMQERAQLLDGKCVFESEIGKGMRVHVSIPYKLAETPILELETEND